MAKNRYVLGEYNFECARCLRKCKSSQLTRTYSAPDGGYILTCERCWEPVYEADFFVPEPDIPLTPQDTRPRGKARYEDAYSPLWNLVEDEWSETPLYWDNDE